MSALSSTRMDPHTAVSLYRTALHPDAWHEVRAPGGYEWWYFDAEDPQTDTQIVAIFLEGFIFHPGYLRHHARFERRPTKRAPALPGDYPCAYLVVYRNGRILHQFMTQYRPDQFSASRERPSVSIGPNTMRVNERGGYVLELSGAPWKLTGRGPKTMHDQVLDASLTFAPTINNAPIERVFLSRAMTGAEHHWVIARPMCHVEGTIRLRTGEAELDRIAFTGEGYHDHNYGTAPIGPGLRRWIWGRAMIDGRAITFHHAVPRDASLPMETHLIRADASGVEDLDVPAGQVKVDWRKRTALLLRYPRALDFGHELRLSNPRVVDSAPFYMRVVYEAESHGQRGSAFCEVAYPHRLRWPVLGRMIEMSIDKSALREGPRTE